MSRQGLLTSGERISILLGLALTMLMAAPGYYIVRDNERLVLVCAGVAALVVVSAILWQRASSSVKGSAHRSLKRLLLWLVAGVGATALWQVIMGEPAFWYQWLPRGMTIGLLLHALYGWWRPVEQ
ncbi:hypothetical protein GCM10010082_10620 [Kushneria pakistanensis]|uniref:Uncharacterized protein n=1 Tax=Kushneria pakistanensis TaxID=1508770 RepID=A0ABQ3FE78_9GAMM|nr:hypothetical protein [Kushneria pakistanensis]GHC20578.1 hypothetical protein GCM10010082_10620 [Kushneria pakistanensis]